MTRNRTGDIYAIGAALCLILSADVTYRIHNVYVGGPTVVTTPTATIPLPPDRADEKAYGDWEYDHVYCYTGTGRYSGDAGYFVEVVESTVPELVGMKFEFC